MSCQRTKILITGASGFIGSFMVEHALKQGYETWAALRSNSSKRYLNDENIHFIELDYSSLANITQHLYNHKQRHGAWDIIIYCAGATKCRHQQDFHTINYWGTRHFVDALAALHITPRQFIYISTLGTYGPQHEIPPFPPITEADTPRPNTAYGQSKRDIEVYLMSLPRFPYVIFRPTGVYGPRDKDYLMLIRSIRHHIEFLPGCHEQRITFLHVYDLVQAVFLAIERGVSQRTYFITDGEVYGKRDFGRIVQETLGYSLVIRIVLPLWAVQATATLCDAIGKITGNAFILNRDKYKILSQRNWTCDITPIIRELGYHPQYNLAKGLHQLLATPKP